MCLTEGLLPPWITQLACTFTFRLFIFYVCLCIRKAPLDDAYSFGMSHLPSHYSTGHSPNLQRADCGNRTGDITEVH